MLRDVAAYAWSTFAVSYVSDRSRFTPIDAPTSIASWLAPM
ncbi:hypothetical protein [Cellulosimicrobium cellulans]